MGGGAAGLLFLGGKQTRGSPETEFENYLKKIIENLFRKIFNHILILSN